jgi:hypothetical protein
MASIDDDRPYWEYQHELDGLRKQVDQLREVLHNVRSEVNGYRDRAEQAEIKVRQMEDARAGVTGARLFFQRADGAENVAQWHYTIDGTRSTCRARIDLAKYSLVELPAAPDDLCSRCAQSLDLELRYNPYEERETPSFDSRKKKTLDSHNAAFFKLQADSNPLFTTYVYLIQSEGENRFKVGISINPKQRIGGLRHAGGKALKVLFLSQPCTDAGARSVEYAVKQEFDRSRVAQEWYRLSWQQVKRVQEIITLTVAQDRNKKHQAAKR